MCLAEEHSPETRESTMKQYLLSIYQPDSKRYDLKLWIGSGDVSAAYLPG